MITGRILGSVLGLLWVVPTCILAILFSSLPGQLFLSLSCSNYTMLQTFKFRSVTQYTRSIPKHMKLRRRLGFFQFFKTSPILTMELINLYKFTLCAKADHSGSWCRRPLIFQTLTIWPNRSQISFSVGLLYPVTNLYTLLVAIAQILCEKTNLINIDF